MADNRDNQRENPDNPDNGAGPGGGNGGNAGGGPGGGGRSGGPEGNMRFSRSMLGWVAIVAAAVALFMFLRSDHSPEPMSWSKFQYNIKQGAFQKVEIKEEGDSYVLTGTPNPGWEASFPNKAVSRRPLNTLDGRAWDELTAMVTDHKGELQQVPNSSQLVNFLIGLIPYLLLFVVIWFFFLRQIRSAGGGIGMLGSFGRSRHRLLSKEHTNITFSDVAGIDEAKEELTEIVEFLKNPKRFQRLGGRIPRGVLLIGDPGVGKTLLAKAIAGEADVPFFSISGSDFVEMFVGVGASRVRDLFKTAKESSPCIIFLDEIDAVGRRRGNGMASGGHDEREQTLNAILVEMDGFDTNDQVIVIAATNRSDVLDPALTRPGRFDRQVNVPMPDIKGRYEILKVHARKVKLAGSVDLMRLARQTAGFSGADLAAIINESALIATMVNKEAVEMADLEEARDKLRWGKARKSRFIDEKDKAATAYHEAGHAIIQWLERESADPIHKVTIVPRGRMGGATMALPEKDRTNFSRKWSISFIKIGLAGRISEEMFTGDINTGVAGDIRQVTGLARAMIREWGMNERVGFVFYGDDEGRMSIFGAAGREYSEETARIIDEEVKKLISDLETETRQMLLAHKDRIEALAQALLKYETLDGADIDRIMKGENLTKPTVTDLLASEQQRRAEIRRQEDKKAPEMEGPSLGPIPQPG